MDEKLNNEKEEFLEKINIASELKNINKKEEDEFNNNLDDDNLDYYDLKKVPVLLFYIKIIYWIFLIFSFLLGIYFFSKSSNPKLREEEKKFKKISEQWNLTKYNDLQDWKFYLKNKKNETIKLDKSFIKFNDLSLPQNLYYKPLEFMKNNTVSLLKSINLDKTLYESSYGGYNLTTKLFLIIDNTFSLKTLKLEKINIFVKKIIPTLNNEECKIKKGSYSYEDEVCYQYYILKTLCIIIDQNTRELYYDYKHFKCNGFDDWYESYTIFPWNIPGFEPSFSDIQESGKKISIYVSSNINPFVYANYYNYKSDKLYNSYLRRGIWCIGLSIFLIVIPLLLLIKDYAEKDKPMTPEKSKIAITSFKTNPFHL